MWYWINYQLSVQTATLLPEFWWHTMDVWWHTELGDALNVLPSIIISQRKPYLHIQDWHFHTLSTLMEGKLGNSWCQTDCIKVEYIYIYHLGYFNLIFVVSVASVWPRKGCPPTRSIPMKPTPTRSTFHKVNSMWQTDILKYINKYTRIQISIL